MKKLWEKSKWFAYGTSSIIILITVIFLMAQSNFDPNLLVQDEYYDNKTEILSEENADTAVLDERQNNEQVDDIDINVQKDNKDQSDRKVVNNAAPRPDMILASNDSPVNEDDEEATQDVNQENFPLAPDFTLIDMQGKEFKLSENLGKFTILNFWASWCGPCKKEIPDFMKLYSENKNKGLQIIGVSVDRAQSMQKLESFYQQMNINYPILKDGTGVGMQYGGVSSIPTTFFINSEGKIIGKIMGLRPHSFFENIIKEYL